MLVHSIEAHTGGVYGRVSAGGCRQSQRRARNIPGGAFLHIVVDDLLSQIAALLYGGTGCKPDAGGQGFSHASG